MPKRSTLPMVGEGKRGVDGHIGYLLRQAAAAQRLRMERALQDLAITPPQFTVLTLLQAYPALSNADLARLSQLSPPTVCVIVGNLLKRDLLIRQAHTQHGRILQLQLSESGQQVLQQCKIRVAHLEAALVQGLTENEDAAIRRWLVHVAQALDDGMSHLADDDSA